MKSSVSSEGLTLNSLQVFMVFLLPLVEDSRCSSRDFLGLMRKVLSDLDYRGFHLPAGTMAMVSPALSHRLPTVFHDPERYDPERFAPPPSRGAQAVCPCPDRVRRWPPPLPRDALRLPPDQGALDGALVAFRCGTRLAAPRAGLRQLGHRAAPAVSGVLPAPSHPAFRGPARWTGAEYRPSGSRGPGRSVPIPSADGSDLMVPKEHR